MSNISWVETVPSGTSRIGDFPTFAKSTFTAVTTGINTSLYWDASGGASAASAGGLKPGGSRAFFAAASASSVPSQGTGRAFLCSDSSRLYVYDSAGTYLGGTSGYIEYQSGPPAGKDILMVSGSTSSTWAAGIMDIPFPVTFASAPVVQVSLGTGISGVVKAYAIVQTASTTTGFRSQVTAFSGSPSGIMLHWTAIGSSASYL